MHFMVMICMEGTNHWRLVAIVLCLVYASMAVIVSAVCIVNMRLLKICHRSYGGYGVLRRDGRLPVQVLRDAVFMYGDFNGLQVNDYVTFNRMHSLADEEREFDPTEVVLRIEARVVAKWLRAIDLRKVLAVHEPRYCRSLGVAELTKLLERHE